MAVSISDLATKIAAAAPASGATFRVVVNADGTLQIFRAASAANPGAPGNPWVLLYGRVVYNRDTDTVVLSDGPGQDTNLGTQTSAAFINALS